MAEYSITELPTNEPFELRGTDTLKEVAGVLKDHDFLMVMVVSPHGTYDLHVRARQDTNMPFGDVLRALDQAKEDLIEDFAE